METIEVQKKLYLEIKDVHPVDYLKELRLALLHLLKRHFEGPPEEMTKDEQFALYRISDFLIKINKGDFIPTDQLCGRDK